MLSIIQNEILAKLPVQELGDSLHLFLQSFTVVLPDARLRALAELMVHGAVTRKSSPRSPGSRVSLCFELVMTAGSKSTTLGSIAGKPKSCST